MPEAHILSEADIPPLNRGSHAPKRDRDPIGK